jgi:electron transport complex protein RnfD
MNYRLSSSPHQHQRRTTNQIMRLVIYTALPGLLVQTWFFGWGAIIHFIIAAIVAVVAEASILELRKKDFEKAVSDGSAVLTALLLAISIPPMAPWWISVIGAFFAIAIVKQLYGGLGFNIFNPAMAAYVMLLVSFPVEMTNWSPAASIAHYPQSFLDALYVIFIGFSSDGYSILQLRSDVDGVTMATPLDHVKTNLTLGYTFSESITGAMFDNDIGIGWFWVNCAYLVGGIYLIKSKVINWHIPAGMIVALFAITSVMYAIDSDHYGSPLFHMFSGGVMLGAFFIATDPVSASTTNRGRLIFGAGIGLWVYLIRTWGGYPDAIAFAVLIMNMAVPLIDYYTRPRTYGHFSEHKKSIQSSPAKKQD